MLIIIYYYGQFVVVVFHKFQYILPFLSFFSSIPRSAEDANVFLVNDFENPLQVHIILIYSFGWLVELLLLFIH
jgi:hypothetical protein